MGRASGIYTSERADVEVLTHLLFSGLSKQERLLDVRNGHVQRDFRVIGLARHPEGRDGIQWYVYLQERGSADRICTHRGEFLQGFKLPMLIYNGMGWAENIDDLVQFQRHRLIGGQDSRVSKMLRVDCVRVGNLMTTFSTEPRYLTMRTGAKQFSVWTDAIFHDRGAGWPFLWIGRVKQGDNWIFAMAQLRAGSSGVLLLF